MAGYFTTLFDSFKPGGMKPYEALFGLYDQDGDTITSGKYNPSVFGSKVEEPNLSDAPASTSAEKLPDNGVGSIVATENNTSADKSAETANQQTSDWFKETMEYNAEQAELDRLAQQSSADKAMDFESKEAEKYREWLEMMSSSQYQRAVADLKEAGLNPILLAQGLSPASTPSASSPSGRAIGGSRASVSQSSAAKAEVDLNSRAKIIEAYLRSETSLKQTEIQSISNLLSALIGLGR